MRNSQVDSKPDTSSGISTLETTRTLEKQWSFENRDLARIFEHYVRKHVPFYDEIHRMVAEISDWLLRDRSRVYDLGTSTGEVILRLQQRHPEKNLQFVVVDSSKEMIEKAKSRLSNVPNVEFAVADLNRPFEIHDASLVTAVLLFQFLEPAARPRLLKEIHNGLREEGGLLMAEKVTGRTARFGTIWTDLHHDLKRRSGVSESEIAAKDESLRGVMLPYSLASNMRLIREAGFREYDVFFKWYNWAAIAALKSSF